MRAGCQTSWFNCSNLVPRPPAQTLSRSCGEKSGGVPQRNTTQHFPPLFSTAAEIKPGEIKPGEIKPGREAWVGGLGRRLGLFHVDVMYSCNSCSIWWFYAPVYAPMWSQPLFCPRT